MSIDELQLTSYLYKNLYTHSLVKEGETTEKPEEEKGMTYSFLGGNERGVLVLVKDEKPGFGKGTQFQLLEKMLQACNLSLKDVAIVNLIENEENLRGLKKFFKPEKVLVFGQDILNLSSDRSAVQVLQKEGLEFLIGPDLSLLIQNPALKKPLWEKLQVFFQINKP